MEKIKRFYFHLTVPGRSLFITYGLALSTSLFGLLIHVQFARLVWNASPFLMFVPAVIITSWYGGFLPGLVATIVGTIIGDFFFLNPLYTFTVNSPADVARLFLFSTIGILISIINQTFYNQRAEKQRIEKQKITFLSIIAHELRTPLAIVQLINQLLINKYKHKKAKKDLADLENMYTELENLSQQMQELLEFVRGEQDVLALHKKNFMITYLIKNIVEIYQKSYPSITFIFQEKHLYSVDADENRIKQVIQNLLDNAIHASEKNSTIYIALHEEKGQLVVSIQDEGVGIPAIEQKHIFDQYYQGAHISHKGFGLGLYIAKQIIQRHGGKIWVESVPQKGSTFFFTIPYETSKTSLSLNNS